MLFFLQELMPMKPMKTKVSITLDEDLVEQLKRLAEEDDRSFSQYLNMILKNWINSKKNDVPQ